MTTKHLTYKDKIGILDPEGKELNPLNQKEYSQEYKDLASVWSKFPTFSKASDVLKSIEENQLTIVVSGTGSGKSVIIPKLALHYANYTGKIAMTLPKKVITYSAASFAAKTLDVGLGKEIGYQFKGSPKNMINDSNKIVYMTDGVMIMKIVRDPTLSEFDVILIDEVHERNVRIDMLLLLIKNLLQSGKRPDLRIILMSATIDTKKYQKYFTGITSSVINIAGQPNHEIKVNFLPEPPKSYMIEGLSLIDDLVVSGVSGDILFFITTSEEALRLCRSIRPRFPSIYCIEVYADMDKDLKIYAETSDKYLELGNYDRKVVMATNVAESSLTIDGLKYVIDSGYELYSYFDPDVYGNVLEKRLITKAQATQRRGRVGRTAPGVCYHLMTESQFNSLQDYPDPNILKEDITMELLKIIQSTESRKLSDGLNLMNQLMDVPKKTYVQSAINLYKMYKIIDSDEKLTKIAFDLLNFSSLSINQTLFMVYAFQMQCAKEASIIVAMIETFKGKITNLFHKADTICESQPCKQSAKQFLDRIVQKKGDHLTFLKIYQEFREVSDQKAWARKFGIRLESLNAVTKLYNQYFNKLISASKAPQLSRISNVDIKKRLLEALKQSHQHLTAKNMRPLITKKDIEGEINKDSTVYQHHKKKDLSNKKFIYNELTNINGNWEFNVITFI